MIYVLTILLAIILIGLYASKEGDFMSPSFLVTAGFFLSSIFAIPLINNYKIPFTLEATLAIILFLFFFYIGDVLSNGIFRRHKNLSASVNINYIYVRKWKMWLYTIFAIVVTIMFYRAIISAVGSGNWLDVIARYRYMTAYQNLTGKSVSISSSVALLRFIVVNGTYLFLHIMINNWVYTEKIQFRYLIVILIGLLNTIIGASRLDLIRLPLAAITIYFIVGINAGKIKRKSNTKRFAKVLLLGTVILYLFSSLRNVVGRKNTASLFEYLGGYIGTSIINLSLFLEKPTKSSGVFGKETFWGVYNFISNLTGNTNFKYDYTLEFNSYGGHSLGNVYTSIRMYYADFGWIGVLVLSAILGFVFSMLYKLLLKNIRIVIKGASNLFGKSIVNYRLIIFSMMMHSVLLAFYADWFYSQVISWTTLKGFIIIWFLKVIIVDTERNNRIQLE